MGDTDFLEFSYFQSINAWLPISEHKLANMKPISTNPETLKQQMEEIKVGKGR